MMLQLSISKNNNFSFRFGGKLKIFDLATGDVIKIIPTKGIDCLSAAHDNNWITIECDTNVGLETLVYDIQNSVVRYVDGFPVGIKGNYIYTSNLTSSSIPISKWDAKTGNLLAVVSAEYEQLNDSYSVVKNDRANDIRSRISISKNGPVVFNGEKLILFSDRADGGLEKVSEIDLTAIKDMMSRKFDPAVPVWHLIQNCAVIYFVGLVEGQRTLCLAFISLSKSSGKLNQNCYLCVINFVTQTLY